METLDATDLELIVFADECDCEVQHTVTICSRAVTHVSDACWDSEKCCSNAAKFLLESPDWQTRSLYKCVECGKNLADCWTIRPI